MDNYISDKCTSVQCFPLFVLININCAFCCGCYSGTGATQGTFTDKSGKTLKGLFGLLKMWLYEVLIDNQCFTCCRLPSTHPSLEKHQEEAEQCSAVDGITALKSVISFSVCCIQNIFSVFLWHQTEFSIRKPNMALSPKQPGSIGKINNFILHTGIDGPPLPQSVNLFVLLCDFGESKLTF